MKDTSGILVALFYIANSLLGFVVTSRPTYRRPNDPLAFAAMAAIGLVSTIAELRVGHRPGGILWAISTALNVWLAWRSKPPRKRKPSKVAARIRDLGHRLVAVPT